ncbi:MAG: hypothetical protein IIA58_01255 [Candidatus Marinimicrobia bacterium]|nr:hypothetical protein [Candidatus Neomarinimicrobiota bacterium]
MDPTKLILDTVTAIATTIAAKGVEITFEKAKEIIKDVCSRDPSFVGDIDIDEMANQLQTQSGNVGKLAYNEETLARFLEIPISDLVTVTPDNLDKGLLYSHIKLEGESKDWLQEWGYEVETGTTLSGLRGVEYIPDVYGQLNTLHGQFEICLNFVCDSPPDEDRVFALLGKIEAYAEAKKTFSYGDIFCIVTPHRFTQGSISAIGLQNEQESYSVFPLDGGDLHILKMHVLRETD